MVVTNGDFSHCCHLASVFDRDSLHLSEEVVGILPSLPPHARVLHPSKWQVQISHQPAVGPHQTSLYPLGHPVNSRHVPGPHGGRETIAHVVALGNGLILGVKGADAGDGPEDLLLYDAGAVRYARNNGGWHEVAVGVALREVQLVDSLTAVDGAAFGLGESNEASDLGIKKKREFNFFILFK